VGPADAAAPAVALRASLVNRRMVIAVGSTATWNYSAWLLEEVDPSGIVRWYWTTSRSSVKLR
jgi:hypothetical protein